MLAATDSAGWEPRAQPSLRPRSAISPHFARPNSAPPAPALDAKLRARLRETLKRLALPEGPIFAGEQRQRTIDAFCKSCSANPDFWWKLPDEVARELLALHISLYRYIQERGSDHYNERPLNDAFTTLRKISAERYPGAVNGFRWEDGPLGSSWLDDIRLHFAALESLARAGVRAQSASASAGPASRAIERVLAKEAATVPAAPAVCADPECQRLAPLVLGVSTFADAPTANDCALCLGSNNTRATLAMGVDLRERGLSRLLIVGGDDEARHKLIDRLARVGIEARGWKGDLPSPSRKEAKADKTWADVVVIWPQGASHKVTGHFNDLPDGTLLVRLGGGGTVQLAAAVRERLHACASQRLPV